MAYYHSPGVYDPKFKSNQQRREFEDMLGEWYGAKFAATEITCRTDSPKKIDEVLDSLMSEKLNGPAMLTLELQEKWDSLIGPPLNRYTRLATIRDNTAVIEVSHPAFLLELRKKSTQESWLVRLKESCPEAKLDSVQFVPGGQHAQDSNK